MAHWPAEYYLQEGDILLNCTGTGTIGRACLVSRRDVDQPKVIDSHVAIIRPNKNVVDPRYLFSWIRSREVQSAIAGLATGATNQIELSRTAIATLPIPLAPLNEQIRIADTIDELLFLVDACRARLDRVPSVLRRFRQAVLAIAASGQLTAKWRVEADLSTWGFERAEHICETVQSGGTPKQGFIEDAGIPFLKVYNIVNQSIDFHYKPQFVTTTVHNGVLAKSRTRPGDVLMNIVGPPLGKVAIVPDEFPEWNINQAIALFRPSERITTKWLYYFLCSGHSVASVEHQTRGSAGQANISLSQCRNFIFPVPPLDEQHEIVRRAEILFAYANNVEIHYEAAYTQIEQLLPVLLTKAFLGELAPQDSNDEPASGLLERMHYAHPTQDTSARVPVRKPSAKDKVKSKENKLMLTKSDIESSHLYSILKVRGPLSPEELWLASRLEIDDFYDQLREEEARNLLREVRNEFAMSVLLEAT
jgi:type I restriction enzyme S subunit